MPRRPAPPVYKPLPRLRQRLPFKAPVRQPLGVAVWVVVSFVFLAAWILLFAFG